MVGSRQPCPIVAMNVTLLVTLHQRVWSLLPDTLEQVGQRPTLQALGNLGGASLHPQAGRLYGGRGGRVGRGNLWLYPLYILQKGGVVIVFLHGVNNFIPKNEYWQIKCNV